MITGYPPRTYETSIPSYATEPLFNSQNYVSPSPARSPSVSSADPPNYPSPFQPNNSFQLYTPFAQRRSSIASLTSHPSQQSPASGSIEFDEDGKEKGRCPHPDCGRHFKDLKAHMLTHQAERPEKCPIAKCLFNTKGFARKYDKNRHTLTHYKGTMVCGFCPGSGSAVEKSFNRADVFKRHLTTVHGVEQTAPNSRKRNSNGPARKTINQSEDATGKCSTCSVTFSNAQDFYEHLDDCVLRIVQREEPSEAINEQHLMEVANDVSVQETLERHQLPTSSDTALFDQIEVVEEEDEDDDERDTFHNSRSGKGTLNPTRNAPSSSRSLTGSGITKSVNPKSSSTANPANTRTRTGLTFSKGGVPLVGKGRKKRKHYPPSWGCNAEKMKMKKRVSCIYDGPRRLWKDDMMMDNQFEVRVNLGGEPNRYVTDLDVQTLARAEALHNATEQEKGPWIQDDVDIHHLMST